MLQDWKDPLRGKIASRGETVVRFYRSLAACPPNERGCGPSIDDVDVKLKAALEQEDWLLRRYQMLIAHPEWLEIASGWYCGHPDAVVRVD